MSDQLSIIFPRPRMIVWYSNGAVSTVTAKYCLDIYGLTHDVRIVGCDTRPSENSDNYRYSKDVEDWLGVEIEYIRNENYETVDDVFEKHRYLSGIKGARCTVELKKKPRFAYQHPDDVHAFGYTSDERKRKLTFQKNNPELKLVWPLIDNGITKGMCFDIVSQAGIRLPENYLIGLDNNNCPGCVKSTSPWYWDMIRHHFPEVFARRADQSRRFNVRLIRYKGKRIFLDELPYGPFKKRKRAEKLSCGPECNGGAK